MVVVLSEASFRDRGTLNGRELQAITETAQLFGCRIYGLPPDLSEVGSVESIFAYVSTFEPPVPGIWIGYMPTLPHYTAIYDGAAQVGIQLVNSPAQHQMAMEFDKFYPVIKELTPASAVAESVEGCVAAAGQLGFPLFVRGAVKSNKEQGWSACVATNESELLAIAEQLFARVRRSRGKIILRQLVKIRPVGSDYNDFPIGREYRIFLYRDQVLAYGFYWDDYTDVVALNGEDEQIVLQLAVTASQKLGVPFLTVDVAQLDSGEWIVIEVGDGQFSGLSQVPILELWSKLAAIHLERP